MFLASKVSAELWRLFWFSRAFLHMQRGKAFCALCAILPATKDLDILPIMTENDARRTAMSVRLRALQAEVFADNYFSDIIWFCCAFFFLVFLYFNICHFLKSLSILSLYTMARSTTIMATPARTKNLIY